MNESEQVELLAGWLAQMNAQEALELQFQRIELMNHTEEMIILQLTLYITFVSAYLAAAYVGGASLSRLQVLIGSAIFTTASTFSALNVMGSFWAFEMQQRGVGLHYLAMAETFGRPDWVEFGRGFILDSQSDTFDAIISALMVAGILGALYFMWSIRHPKVA